MQVVIYFHKTGFKKTSFSPEKDANGSFYWPFLLLQALTMHFIETGFAWNSGLAFYKKKFSFKLILFSINAFSLNSRF